MDQRAAFPHCDSRVLHAPGQCEFCDEYPDRQMLRLRDSVNFTGQSLPGRSKCPAEQTRPLATIEAWRGNVAKKPIAAWTRADSMNYPGYVNISYMTDGVCLSVRSDRKDNGSCGDSGSLTISYEVWQHMLADLGIRTC